MTVKDVQEHAARPQKGENTEGKLVDGRRLELPTSALRTPPEPRGQLVGASTQSPSKSR